MMENLAIIFEIVMVVCFGLSWPLNIIKAYKARTTKGTSLYFMLFIVIGYVGGICSKLFFSAARGPGYWTFLTILAFVFYIINFIMVSTGLVIYFRNKRLDKLVLQSEKTTIKEGDL